MCFCYGQECAFKYGNLAINIYKINSLEVPWPVTIDICTISTIKATDRKITPVDLTAYSFIKHYELQVNTNFQ